MFGYIIRRLISAFLVVVATSMIVFALFFLGPTNTADYLCQPERPLHAGEARQPQEVASASTTRSSSSTASGSKDSCTSAVEFDAGATYPCDAPCLGISFVTKAQVTDELKIEVPVTLSLAIGGAVSIFLTLGITTGVLSARRRGTVADKALVEQHAGHQLDPVLPGCLPRVAVPHQSVGHLRRQPRTPRPYGQSRQMVRRSSAALARHRHLQRDPICAVQPRLDGRDAQRRLRPHRRREGRPDAHCDRQARVARCDRADRDHLRPRLRASCSAGDRLHRADLRHRRRSAGGACRPSPSSTSRLSRRRC